MSDEPRTVEAPPAEIVLTLLIEKAQTEPMLAAWIEAAQWKAIVVTSHNDTGDDPQDSVN